MKNFIEERNDNIFNIKQDELTTYTASLSVADILRWINDSNGDAITLQCPEFQRDSSIKNNKSVWKNNTKIIFIDSLLRGLPSPSILIWEKIDGNKKEYFLLDGSQRLSSINDFVNGKKINNSKQKLLKLNNKQLQGSNYYNKSYIDLDEIDKTNFNNYRIDAVFIRYVGIHQEHEISVISEIFARLNSGSFNLNRSEIRHSIFFKKKDFVFDIIDSFINDKGQKSTYFYLYLKNIKKYLQNKRGALENFLLRLLSYAYYLNNNESGKYTFESSVDCTIDNYICRLNDEKQLKLELEKIDTFFEYLYKNEIKSLHACKRNNETGDLTINDTAILESFSEALFSYIIFRSKKFGDIKKILESTDWSKIEKIKNKIWNEGYFKNINKKSDFSLESSFFYSTTSNKSVWNRFEYLKHNIGNEK